MIWLGLAVAVAFVPGYLGATIPTQWALLSCVLPLALWRKGPMTLIHWLGAAFLCYAAASLYWAFVYEAGVGELWQLGIIALAFWLGSTLTSLRRLWIGLGIGMTISSAVSVAQYLGYNPVLTYLVSDPGLFFNPMIHGEVLALVAIGLLSERLLWLVPGLLPGLILSNSRGALLMLLIGFIITFIRHPLALAVLGLSALLILLNHPQPSDYERMEFWLTGWNNITLWGHGVGSFQGLHRHGTPVIGNVHNDYIQWAFEFGIGAVLLYVIYGFCLCQAAAREWPIFATFACMSLFSFPFYMAPLAFIGALCAGRIARDWSLSRRLEPRSRYDLLQRFANQ